MDKEERGESDRVLVIQTPGSLIFDFRKAVRLECAGRSGNPKVHDGFHGRPKRVDHVLNA